MRDATFPGFRPARASSTVASAPPAIATAHGWWRGRRRRALAVGYERVILAAELPRPGYSAQVPVQRAATRRCFHELTAILGLLRSDRALPEAGLVAARRLLVDSVSPLYVAGDLDSAVRSVLDRLEGGARP